MPPPIERKKLDLSPLKNARVPIIFVMGGPGSGKGTQCEQIVKKYGFTHLSSGDLLREEVQSGSEFGKYLKAIMKEGALVSLEMVLDLISAVPRQISAPAPAPGSGFFNFLSGSGSSSGAGALRSRLRSSGSGAGTALDLIKAAMLKFCKSSTGFLIDGYPREVAQGVQFEEEIQPASLVLFFDAAESTLVKRLLKRGETSGRSDDNEETIKKRLRTFEQLTKPVVEYYGAKGKLAKINADRTIGDIFKEVCTHLDRING